MMKSLEIEKIRYGGDVMTLPKNYISWWYFVKFVSFFRYDICSRSFGVRYSVLAKKILAIFDISQKNLTIFDIGYLPSGAPLNPLSYSICFFVKQIVFSEAFPDIVYLKKHILYAWEVRGRVIVSKCIIQFMPHLQRILEANMHRFEYPFGTFR